MEASLLPMTIHIRIQAYNWKLDSKIRVFSHKQLNKKNTQKKASSLIEK